MGKKLTKEQAAELEQLRNSCLTVLEYIGRRADLGELGDEFRAAVETLYTRRDVRELRALRRDFQEWVNDLPAESREQLEATLRLLDARAPANDLEIALARGRIEAEDEYRAVLAQIEHIYDDPAREPEVTRLNALLTEYDLRTSK